MAIRCSIGFGDADPVVTCECGARLYGDSVNDAVLAWARHITTDQRHRDNGWESDADPGTDAADAAADAVGDAASRTRGERCGGCGSVLVGRSRPWECGTGSSCPENGRAYCQSCTIARDWSCTGCLGQLTRRLVARLRG